MASIIKKKKKGKIYYYLAECQRVNGKPRIVWQKYLGPAEAIVERLQQTQYPKPQAIHHRAFGEVCALLKIAVELGIVELINQHVSKRAQGFSVGEYLLLVALNRACHPQSKSGIATWYSRTVLPRLMKIPKTVLDSQNFWDQMSYLDEEAIEKIEDALCEQVLSTYQIELDLLLYDTTNYFTFLDPKTPSDLQQRGNNKAKRFDLRQFNLALLATRDFGIPLLSMVYAGNRHESPLFPTITEKLVARHKLFSKQCDRITLVFDKGNTSKTNLEKVDDSPYHFVGSLTPSHHQDLLGVPLQQYEPVGDVLVYRTKKRVFRQDRTVLVTYNEALYRKKCYRLDQVREKTRAALFALKGELKTKCVSKQQVQKQVEAILSKSARNLFLFWIEEEKGLVTLSFRLNQDEVKRREKQFGKNVLFTDNHHWSSQEIIETYKQKNDVEVDFKRTKDPNGTPMTPVYHWTDQKVRVHAFCCVLSLLMVNLLHYKLSQHHITISLEKARQELRDIREISFVYGQAEHVQTDLSQCSPLQQQLSDALGLQAFAPKIG